MSVFFNDLRKNLYLLFKAIFTSEKHSSYVNFRVATNTDLLSSDYHGARVQS